VTAAATVRVVRIRTAGMAGWAVVVLAAVVTVWARALAAAVVVV